MSAITTTEQAITLATLLEARRSTRKLTPASFPPDFVADLAAAAHVVPSAFDTQPWRIVALRERNRAFWDRIEETITARLEGDRRMRYLARADQMRHGGMTLLVFEDRARSAPRDGVSGEEARDQAAQSIGMVQLALWLTITAHGLSTSLQHWHAIIEDIALDFVGLPQEAFRLVSFMPVGEGAELAASRPEAAGRFAMEDGTADT